jgi:predicted O-methyltransferase YrrM
MCILELGTCVGISGSYLATALKHNGQGGLWTIEGSPKIADIALETLSNLGLLRFATVIRGPFLETLSHVLSDHKFDFVFIDGHHEGSATIDYFNQIKLRLRRGAIVLFDDIEWSADMSDAWRTIRSDAALTETATALGFGLCQAV